MRILILLIASTFSTLLAAREIREICPQPIPYGWVVISSRPCAGCCGSGMGQMLTIERAGNDRGSAHHDDEEHQDEEEHESERTEIEPGLTRTEICPQPIPYGWVVVSKRYCAGCCGSGMTDKLTIQRIEHAPKGTRVEMCPQATPPGWAVVSSRPCAGCCGSGMTEMLTIEKL